PTIFALRFTGGPTGLWRLCRKRHIICQKISQFFAFLFLVAINAGAIDDCFATYQSLIQPDRSFVDNENLFYSLALNVTGALALDILWYRRRLLRELLDMIDLEHRICIIFDEEIRRANARIIRKKSCGMFVFMVSYAWYTIWSVIDSSDESNIVKPDNRIQEIHCLIVYIIRCLSVLVFSIILSFYISLSWVFRLKVRRINQHLKKQLSEATNKANDANPAVNDSAKIIELWFRAYIIQSKKFEIIFKQIAGMFYMVMIYSILALAQIVMSAVLNNLTDMSPMKPICDGIASLAIIVYFLYSVSIVEHYLLKVARLLYQLSLTIRFRSDDNETITLSKKFKLLGWTIHRTGLSLTIFGIININRHLIISTASLLVTYSILMYEFTSGKHSLFIH
ncbi:unnamed protein product, partial [Oppiella nova]